MVEKEATKKHSQFHYAEQEAILNMVLTYNMLIEPAQKLLTQANLTPQQFNVLRILRGAKKDLPCGEIRNRMITRESDITRLMDRLLKIGLIERFIPEKDRRMVLIKITKKGLAILRDLDEPIKESNQKFLGKLSRVKLNQLISLLKEIRKFKEHV